MAEETNVDELMPGPPQLQAEDFKFVDYHVEPPVARLTLNRPERNMLDERFLTEIARGIELLHEKDGVKLIVLDSAVKKFFSAGVDLREYSAERVFQMLDAFYHVFSAMIDVGKPVMAVVNGDAIGGGSELAAFADLIVATPNARFAQPEIRLGVFPPLASTIFPYIVGPKLALELVLTGQHISGERARDLGLVNRLVPEDQLEKTVNEIITQITSQSGAVLTMAKRAILAGMGLSLRDGLRNSMNIFLNELYKLDDSQEGLRALTEKRKPEWKNR